MQHSIYQRMKLLPPHLIISVFNGIESSETYIMSIRQFVENSGVKKYDKYDSFERFY